MQTTTVKAFGTEAAEAPLKTLNIERRAVMPSDVEIEILYCGICHSDLHAARNEWMNTVYPIVPGHEIVGRVTQVGDAVAKFKPGDLAAVGCLVDSCRECEYCREGLEQFCEPGATLTFNSPDKFIDGQQTYGGYSQSVVVDERFVLSVPESLDPAAAAPLLCAGITTYSPLRHWNVGPGTKVGVVGLGGLGHMAIKLAKAMGAEVTVFTTSPSKVEDAKRLGADDVVLSRDEEQMAAHANTLNFILDAVSAPHDINAYLGLLRADGTLVLVGAPLEPLPVVSFNLILGRKSFAGSPIGGLPETQEMLDFCAEHNVVPDIELIGVDDVNDAYERLLKGDVRYRFVIDMKTLN
ncbi:MAG: NAD(P)-dependent alcohol dehydrogenase [Acidobacteria bacterium]|nr:NAD(P)-dependent alcohol dehydrogenase [Acidobacteriota bacterium]